MANKISFGRAVLALAAVAVVAGPAFVLADPPNPDYVPQSAILIGPRTIKVGVPTQYTLEVTFTNGKKSLFPPTTGATFAVTPASAGTISPGGVFTASSAGRAGLTGTYIAKGVKAVGSRTVNVTP